MFACPAGWNLNKKLIEIEIEIEIEKNEKTENSKNSAKNYKLKK
jgi:hypothetical protein